MGGVHLSDTIGGTPLVRLDRFLDRRGEPILAKWEAVNPGGSIKDRPAAHIVRAAENAGLLRPGGTIVEATSGNFGVALAMIGAARGYRVIIVIDPKLPFAHRKSMAAYGAEIVEVTEPDASGGYFQPRLETANRIAAALPDAFRPDQHFSLMNAAAHFFGTAREIIAQSADPVDHLVVPVSTAGQVRGLGEYFRQFSPHTRIVAVDAVGSGALGGDRHAYLQTGIGLAWPPSNLDVGLIDEMYRVVDADAFATCRHLATRQGLLAGASSGSVVFAALHLAQTVRPDARIVCVLSDSGVRYLDTVYDDDWLRANGVTLPADFDALLARAGALAELQRADVLAQVARVAAAGKFEPAFAPSTTASLNAAAARSMAPAGVVGTSHA